MKFFNKWVPTSYGSIIIDHVTYQSHNDELRKGNTYHKHSH